KARHRVYHQKEPPPQKYKQRNQQKANQENAPAELQLRKSIVKKRQQDTHGSEHLHQARQHFPSIAQNEGIVQIEVIHAHDEHAGYDQDFQKSLLVVQHQRGVARPQSRDGRRYERERHQKRLGNPQKQRSCWKIGVEKANHSLPSESFPFAELLPFARRGVAA